MGFVLYIRPLQTVLDVFKAQVIATIAALIIVAMVNIHILLSFFLGELAMLTGNAFLAFNVYRQHKRMAPMSLLLSFMLGEVGKYVVLVIFTIIFAKTIALNWLFYAIGVFTPQVLGVVVYLILNRSKKA